MSRYEFVADFVGNFDANPIQIQDPEEDNFKRFKTVQLVDEITALYKNRNFENQDQNQDQEEEISMARENAEDFLKTYRSELKAQAKKEKKEMRNKLVKTGVILILCFLLLNFVLVVINMSWTSKLSSSSSLSSTSNFSALENQTDKTAKIVHEIKFELGGIGKWKNSTEEQLERHHLQIESLSNQTKIDKLLEQVEALENKNVELKTSHDEIIEQLESLSQKLKQLENPRSLQSCSDAMEILPSSRSTKQRIYPNGNFTSLEVLCDFETDGGGWTIIQKRSSGPREEFNRNWTDYANGFGSLDKNFWIGLENIHALTQNGDQELRIELEDFEGEKRWAKYSSFSISEASDFYRLAISGFYENSTAGDSMANPNHERTKIHSEIRFSTADMDNDNSAGNCASGRGGWWFNECSSSNLNGLYEGKENTGSYFGIRWDSWKGAYYSLAKTEIKIRTKKTE